MQRSKVWKNVISQRGKSGDRSEIGLECAHLCKAGETFYISQHHYTRRVEIMGVATGISLKKLSIRHVYTGRTAASWVFCSWIVAALNSFHIYDSWQRYLVSAWFSSPLLNTRNLSYTWFSYKKNKQYLPATSLAGGNNSPTTQHPRVHDVEKASFISELAQL